MKTGSLKTNDRPIASLSLWLKSRYRLLWWCVLLLSALPALWLYWLLAQYIRGVGPLQALQQGTGFWSFCFLLLTLSITPLRRLAAANCQRAKSGYGKRLSDWNWIIRLRRMLGLYSFVYALMHVVIWRVFQHGNDTAGAMREIADKPYLSIGVLSFIVLVPLAATSTQWSMRRLGRRWRTLHRATYLVVVLALAHHWLALKPWDSGPVLMTSLTVILLFYRLLALRGWLVPAARDDGMEVKER